MPSLYKLSDADEHCAGGCTCIGAIVLPLALAPIVTEP
jgi:hypothetical protein